MPPKPVKRAHDTSNTTTPKKARLSVPESETEQVTNIEEHRLPMKNASVYYIDDFLDGDLATDLYTQLLEIDGCQPIAFSPHFGPTATGSTLSRLSCA